MKTQVAGLALLLLQVFDSVGLGWARICISSNFPDDSVTANGVKGPYFENHFPRASYPNCR